eukprot:scaffold40984_cov61-Phaeocystis_antarctica.AAC.2
MITQARCDVLVGKFTSGLFRAAYQLSAAEHGLLRPFVSLDAPWCADSVSNAHAMHTPYTYSAHAIHSSHTCHTDY